MLLKVALYAFIWGAFVSCLVDNAWSIPIAAVGGYLISQMVVAGIL